MGLETGKDEVYQYHDPNTGLPVYTGHSVRLKARHKQHLTDGSGFSKYLNSFDEPPKPVILQGFNSRVEAVECEIYHMFADHTWFSYGGFNFVLGDLPNDPEGLYRANSARMKTLQATPDFAKANSERMKARQAALTPGQRSERSRRAGIAANAAMTPEQRSERLRRAGLAYAAMTPKQHSERGRRISAAAAAMTPEQRSERAHRGAAAMTPEQRSERSYHANAALTPKQRSERSRRGAAAMTPEQRSERAHRGGARGGRIGACKRWNINRGKSCTCGKHNG